MYMHTNVLKLNFVCLHTHVCVSVCIHMCACQCKRVCVVRQGMHMCGVCVCWCGPITRICNRYPNTSKIHPPLNFQSPVNPP